MPVSFDSNCKELEPLLLSILDKPKITAWLQKTTVDESNLHIDIFDAERTVAHLSLPIQDNGDSGVRTVPQIIYCFILAFRSGHKEAKRLKP